MRNINLGHACSLYRNIKHIGFNLPLATKNTVLSRYTKGLTSALAVLAISGCVSQQSALDFNGQQVTQPVPTGVSLVGDSQADTNTVAVATSNNIPIKAPRPTANVAQVSTATPTAPIAETATQTQIANQTPTTLAVAQTPTQVPTANVIAAATTQPQTQTVASQTAQIQSTVQQNVPPASATPAPAVVIPAPSPAQTQQSATTVAQTSHQSVEVASLSPTVEAAPSVEAPQTEVVKKKTFFEKLFTPKEKTPRPSASVKKPKVDRGARASSRISTANSVAERPKRKITKPKVTKPKTIVASARTTTNDSGNALPGVKSNNEIFGIKNEGPDTSKTNNATKVAAVGSFGRLSPNGLRVQHSKVQVACLKPGVLRILKQVERRYGKKPIITSGYRSPKGNRRAGGARNSQHIFCKAVDIQVEGVSKWNLAKYLRTIPGRGGVGTYCRTKSVHFDIGSKRDWHHPCRKSAKRKRKKT